MLEMILKANEKKELQVTDQVDVVVIDMPPIPAGANPFHHDLTSMGTDLVRGWMVMHDGFDRVECPRPLHGMYLVNTRTGQRIMLKFLPRPK